MNLTTQKKLAAKILKVGVNRVWIDPEHMEEVSRAITRNSVKALINNGVIKKVKEKEKVKVVEKGQKEQELLKNKHG